MENYGLDFHSQMLLEEYRAHLPVYKMLQQVVMEKMQELVERSGLELNSME